MGGDRIVGQRCWYVVQTKPREEKVAEQHLQRQGFEVFLPLCRKIVSHARKKQAVLSPLFPGYLFIKLNPEGYDWRPVNGSRGVRRLVGANPIKPQPMPAHVMEELLRRCDEQSMYQRDDLLYPGNVVKIAAGPFLDRLAVVEQLDASGRVSLLLEILGSNQSIRMQRKDVIAA